MKLVPFTLFEGGNILLNAAHIVAIEPDQSNPKITIISSIDGVRRTVSMKPKDVLDHIVKAPAFSA